MDELVQWYGEQLDADERIAEAATPGPWRVRDEGVVGDDGQHWPVAYTDSYRAREDCLHVAAHDPARVLREIDVKRQLVALHAVDYRERPDRVLGEVDDPFCAECVGERYPCTTLRLLALPYADRSGCREEWRP
ncbi:hypothetical protein DCW30_05760 [Streptomyces alfalfae]|uniref:Uncharacterized protein n=1 Tax=Streptomyces alfalfae TaxID=1642299 RepID=A0ABM6GW79_9ACTN|nr:DUF6221 family protein [Streptomyces alfalfae]APY88193.1 hypothetical protein A7J05_23110 [Streptomyces alfalfae]AYA18589.1 hypothetical protein D3X13_22225 [Streptomyces fradiae]RXX46530.1 hypothetical protein DCW30_05760 [Streptomyces alfalfae]RZM90043.1 hypothetical protein D4104_25695 [Streptomyces alfalfae]